MIALISQLCRLLHIKSTSQRGGALAGQRLASAWQWLSHTLVATLQRYSPGFMQCQAQSTLADPGEAAPDIWPPSWCKAGAHPPPRAPELCQSFLLLFLLPLEVLLLLLARLMLLSVGILLHFPQRCYEARVHSVFHAAVGLHGCVCPLQGLHCHGGHSFPMCVRLGTWQPPECYMARCTPQKRSLCTKNICAKLVHAVQCSRCACPGVQL